MRSDKCINHRYEVASELTRGESSTVYLVNDRKRGGMRTVLKVFRLVEGKNWDDARREFEVLQRLHHPQIAEVFNLGRVEHVTTPEANRTPAPSRPLAQQAPPLETAPDAQVPRPGDAFLTSEYVDGIDLRRAFELLFPERRGASSGADGGRPGSRPDGTDGRWRTLYRTIGRVALGLEAIHARGLVHHDIKPENIVLIPSDIPARVADGNGDGVPHDFDARIIDFGFAQDETTPLGRRIRGTVPYLAPEVLSGSFADGRSDLYSLGVALVHAITGRFPFPVDSPESWFRFLRSHDDLDLGEFLLDVPAEFVDLLTQLTRIDAASRLESASALLDRLETIGRFSLLERSRNLQLGIPVIGWEREQNVLRNELESLQVGEPGYPLILIEADEESYVDRVAEEIEALATVAEAACLRGRGRCPSRHPYQSVTEALAGLVKRVDLTSSAYRRFGRVLHTLLPDLETESASPRDQRLEPREARLQLIETLTELLVRFGRECPAVLLLEDLHQADADSLQLLDALARNLHRQIRQDDQDLLPCEQTDDLPARRRTDDGDEPGDDAWRQPLEGRTTGVRALIVGVYRVGRSEPGEPGDETATTNDEIYATLETLSSKPYCLKLRLPPLDAEQLKRWVRQRDPGLTPSNRQLRSLHELSGGQPRLLDEILRSDEFRKGIALSAPPADASIGRQPSFYQFDGSPGTTIGRRFPFSLEEALLAKFQGLGAVERQVLEVLAVSGASIELELLRRLVRRDNEDATEGGGLRPANGTDEGSDSDDRADGLAAQLRRLVEHSLIVLRHSRTGLEVAWSHSSAHRHVYSRVPRPRRRQLHVRNLELLLEVEGDKPSEEIAAHAARADRLDLLVRYGTAAAERHLAAHSFQTAVRLYEDSLRHLSLPIGGASLDGSGSALAPEEFEEKRWEALWRLGQIYRLSRNYPRAIEKFTVLLSLEENSSDSGRRAEIYRILGEIYHDNGDQVNAHYFLQKSLSLLEEKAPGAEIFEALLALSKFDFQRGQHQSAEVFAQRAVDALGAEPDSEASARVFLHLGSVCAERNDQDACRRFHSKALEAARNTHDLSRILEVGQALGVTYMTRGEYDKALEQFTRGVELATLLGSKKTLARLYNQISTIHFNRANRALALDNSRRSLRLWKEIGDQRGIANSYNNLGLALCLTDDYPQAAECYRRSIEIFTRHGDQHGQAAGMNNLASILEMEGSYGEALDYAIRSLEKRKRFDSRLGIAYSYYTIAKIYQANGELDKAFGYADKGLQTRHQIGDKMGIANSKIQIADLLLQKGRLREAIRTCEEGEKEFEILDNHYGLIAARELRARICVETGDLEEAAKLLEATLREARQSHEQLLTGRALYGLGRVASEREDYHDAELNFDRAESVFTQNRNRRELTELLLDACRLSLSVGNLVRASTQLETAYELLEELGIRDLIPLYFLLRGRLEIEGLPSAPERGKKFLERALLEAREASLPDVHWRVLLRLGLLDATSGHGDAAEEHLTQAVEILKSMKQELPESSAARFFELPERRMLRQTLESLQRPQSAVDSQSVAPRSDARDLQTGATPSALEIELQEQRTLNRRLLKLQEINKALNTELELERLLEKVMDAVLDLMDAERGFLIVRVPGKTRHENITVARDIDRERVENPETKISHSICDEVLRTGKPVLTTSAISDDRFFTAKSVQDLRLLSVLCVPLRTPDQVVGALYVDNRTRLHAFEEADRKILETFSDQATTAFMNARLSEELRNRNTELVEVNEQMEDLNSRLLHEVEERDSELRETRAAMEKELRKYQAHRPYHNIVGRSKPMQQIFEVLERIAPTNLPVLIQGESGTGKELVARAIHNNSTRKERRFVSENCAALSDSLLESELFGHTRGAFTGATSAREGLFEVADGGTLLLDEVAEMSLAMQKKLLRVLEEGELRRVGDKKTVKIDVRIIAAANRDLRKLVEEGTFRNDLYYRLDGVRVDLPPLRERRQDIPLLVHYFLDEIARESGFSRKQVSPEGLRVLGDHSWPGNVRELKHFLERTVLLLDADTLGEADCRFDSSQLRSPPVDTDDGILGELVESPLREARDHFTKYYVERIYARHDFNATHAARACGMSRESFHRFLKKFAIGKGGN